MLSVVDIRDHHTPRRILATQGMNLTEAKETHREALKQWIRDGMSENKISFNKLTDKIGVATTTISKFVNDPRYKYTPKAPVIEKLEDLFGSKAPGSAATKSRPARKSEGELLDLATLSTDLRNALEALAGNRKGIEFWKLRSTAIEGGGFHPGDILIVDTHAYINAGEAVVASVMDPDDGTRRFVFRSYQKPYLQALSTDPDFLGVLEVDDKYVIVRGGILGRISWNLPN